METENKILWPLFYFITLLFSVLSAGEIIAAAFNMNFFNISLYTPEYWKYITLLTSIAALVSAAGIALFIVSYCLRGKREANTLFLYLQGLVVTGLIIIIILCASKVTTKQYDTGEFVVVVYDYDLYVQTQAMFIRQTILFLSPLFLNIFRIAKDIFKEKKEKTVYEEN